MPGAHPLEALGNRVCGVISLLGSACSRERLPANFVVSHFVFRKELGPIHPSLG